jgi:hypothetical protein
MHVTLGFVDLDPFDHGANLPLAVFGAEGVPVEASARNGAAPIPGGAGSPRWKPLELLRPLDSGDRVCRDLIPCIPRDRLHRSEPTPRWSGYRGMNSNILNPALPGFHPRQPVPTAPTADIVTPKASRADPQRATVEATRPDPQDDCPAEVFLLDERRESDATSVIYLARVREPERLLHRRGMHFHGDVIEALSDLVRSFVGREPSMAAWAPFKLCHYEKLRNRQPPDADISGRSQSVSGFRRMPIRAGRRYGRRGPISARKGFPTAMTRNEGV